MRYVTSILLLLVVGVLPAALIDIDYQQLRADPIGAALEQILRRDPQDAPNDAATANLERVMMTWSGIDGPPILTYRGVDAQAVVARFGGAQAIQTKAGPAYPLPSRPKYALVVIDDRQVVVATKASLDALPSPDWLAPHPAHAIVFSGIASDLRLEDFSEYIAGFAMTMSAEGKTLIQVQTPSRDQAKDLISYINHRRPLLSIAAALGIEKAQFPNRLVDAARIQRRGANVVIDVDLAKDKQLHTDLEDFLVSTLRKRIKQFSK